MWLPRVGDHVRVRAGQTHGPETVRHYPEEHSREGWILVSNAQEPSPDHPFLVVFNHRFLVFVGADQIPMTAGFYRADELVAA